VTPGAIQTPSGVQEPELVRVSPSGTRRSQVVYAAVISMIIIAAVWLRWSGLNSQSMWADEGFTTWFSQFSPGVQWHLLAWDNGAPIYYVVLHYWVSLFGNSETSFRALSALFSTLSLFAFYLIARKVWPDRLFVSLGLMLYSFSFFQIWYAKESRCYALFEFLLLATIYCMLQYLSEDGALRLVSVTITLSLCLYTHNMALFYLPGFAVFWFLYPSRMPFATRLKKAALVGLVVLIMYAPWLPTLVKQMASVHGYFWAPKPRATDVFNTLFTFSGLDIYVLQDIRSHLPISRFFGLRSWTLLLLLTLVACMAGTWWGVRSIDRRKSIALQLWTLLPIGLVFVWSQISTPVYVERNLIGACALMPMILFAPIAVQGGNLKKTFQTMAFVLLAGTVTSLSMHQQKKEDWRGVTDYLLRIPEQRRLVVVLQPYCQILVNYYSTGLFKSYAQPEITGLVTDFHKPPSGPGIFPNLQAADPEQLLSQAIETKKFKEIDVALQLERLPPRVQAIPEFLRSHCSSVENIGFGNLGVSRCFVRQN